MSDDVLNVQNKILSFSTEEQLYLLAYIANVLNNKKREEIYNPEFVRKAGIGKDPNFYMSPDFDAPLEDFKEYM